MNWAEKDKDLLQMIIGEKQNKTHSIDLQRGHSTPLHPKNHSHFAAYCYLVLYYDQIQADLSTVEWNQMRTMSVNEGYDLIVNSI